jgi:excisionase family DNA binding protein
LTIGSGARIVVDDNIMEGYVTVDEAARQLGRSIEQVRRYLREGKLPGRRIGQQWFIEEVALAVWHPERRVGRVSEAVGRYQAKPMETQKGKKFKPLLDPELMREIDETAKRIHDQIGDVDVVELIRQIREDH